MQCDRPRFDSVGPKIVAVRQDDATMSERRRLLAVQTEVSRAEVLLSFASALLCSGRLVDAEQRWQLDRTSLWPFARPFVRRNEVAVALVAIESDTMCQ